MEACTQMNWPDVVNTAVVCATALGFLWLFLRAMADTESATPEYLPPTLKPERADQRSDRINRAARRAAAQQKEQTK